MELFSEIYNCYYQIMKHILQDNSAISLEDLRLRIENDGYEESLLYLIPKLTQGEWDFFHQDGDVYVSKLSENFYVPLTKLQQAYIKTILLDSKMPLFLDTADIEALLQIFQDVVPLWQTGDFYYYDRYTNRDPYEDADYIRHFRTIITAIEKRQYLDISYESKLHHRVHHHYLPCRLEYSIKNDKFRLLGTVKGDKLARVEILNLDRMKEVALLEEYVDKLPAINKSIRESYYKEPVRLLIHNDRNALERAMLQFANYEKNTKKIDDNTYECLIYYNQKMETELLIEILAFGPMIEVLGNERFLEQVKMRLRRQKRLSI